MIKLRQSILSLILVPLLVYRGNAQESFLKTFKFEYKHYFQASWLGDNGEIVIGALCAKDSGQGTSNVLLMLDSHGELTGDTEYIESPYSFTGIKRIPEFSNRLLVCGRGLGNRSWLTTFSQENKLLFDSNYGLAGNEFGWMKEVYYSPTQNEIFTIGGARPSVYRNQDDWGILIQRFRPDGTRIFKNILMDTGNYKLPNWFSYSNSNTHTYTVISHDHSKPSSLRSVILDSLGNKLSVNVVLENVSMSGPILRLANDHYVIFKSSTSGFNDTLFAVELSANGEFISSKIAYKGVSLPGTYQGAGCIMKDSGYLFTYSEDMIRTDKNFNVLWRKTIPKIASMIVYQGYCTKDGGILLIGIGSIDSIYNARIIVVKLDSLGMLNPTGLKEMLTPVWRISANPVSNEIQIEGEIKGLRFTLIDFQGKIIVETANNKIDVSNLKEGVYSLLATGNGNENSFNSFGVRKVVILH